MSAPLPSVNSDADIADTLTLAATLSARFAADAPEIDRDDAFPVAEFHRLAELGFLAAPLPRAHGGLGLGIEPGRTLPLLGLLKQLGRGNLSVGRVYEGHVNALQLIETFGTQRQMNAYATDVREHRRLFGVWNTEPADGVRLVPVGSGRYRLHGAKTFASGAGHVDRPLITGALPDGGWQMCVVPMERSRVAIDPSGWRPIGMRASASYRVDFDGIELEADALIGAPGDYYREPWFNGGAARFAAVQLGGAEALFQAAGDELQRLNRIGDPYQRARFGAGAIAIESGNLWLRGAADLIDRHTTACHAGTANGAAADGMTEPTIEAVVAYAQMARLAIETICLDVIRLAERSVGARGLMRPHPIERILRDLTMYLRQPAPDAVLANVGRVALESSTHGFPGRDMPSLT